MEILEWQQWSKTFETTVHNRAIRSTEKLSHLKTLLTAKPKLAIASRGYSGELYGEAWVMLERGYGRPYLFAEVQQNTLQNQRVIRMHDSKFQTVIPQLSVFSSV